MMDIQDRIDHSITSIFKTVFPNTTNHYDTLFGGTAMLMMDEVAFITATRFTRKICVTVATDNINFEQPIPSGTIVELIGKVSRVGNKSLDITVDVFVEDMYSEKKIKAVTGKFVFVALDKNKKPVSVL